MRFLIIGAGAVGGYFGGRLIEKGEDVTFLVREKRQKQLMDQGIIIKSTHGDFNSPCKTISVQDNVEPFDVIIVATKAYHVTQVMQDMSRFVGTSTMILPLLNGYQHIPALQQEFGTDKVLGGLCFIETTLDEHGAIVQTSGIHNLAFGEWTGTNSGRVKQIFEHMDGVNFNVSLSENIQQAIWHKYIFITSMSGITTLMNAPIGPIMADPNAREIYTRLVDEIVTIAGKANAPAAEDVLEKTISTTESLAPSMKSSMQRDMEKGFPTEVDHLHGGFLSMAKLAGDVGAAYPILHTVYSRLKVYEQVR